MNEVSSKPLTGEVPFAVTDPDRIPARRYYDQEFYDLEVQHLWPRVWQMACRLEEIPEVGDYTVYRNLDQSVIVIRTAPDTVKAYHNHCRHRGVELAQGRGKSRGEFICPFHGWRWDNDGNNTFLFADYAFAEDQKCKDDLALKPVRVETWSGCAFINLDENAPPLRDTLGTFGTIMDLFKTEDLKVEWWKAALVPCNWKLAMEAFMEGYHVATTHPQLLNPGVTNKPGSAIWLKIPEDAVTVSFWATVGPDMTGEMEPSVFIDNYIRAMRILNEGMAGMAAIEECEVAETLRGMDLPRNPMEALTVFRKALNEAVGEFYRKQGTPMGDIAELDRLHLANSVNYLFPHFFLLPIYGAASSYRIRPLGPEQCLFELWSLKRYPADVERPIPVAPTPVPHDDPSWPAIPKQDYSNLPRQQRGLHTGGFDFMRLSDEMEGLISNYHRTIDGFLGGVPADKLAKAMSITSGPIDSPVRDLGF